MPQGSIYGLDLNKSVELVIPGGAIGGPVSIGVYEYCNEMIGDLTIDCGIDSTLSTYTVITSTWSVALVTRPTTSSIQSSEMS